MSTQALIAEKRDDILKIAAEHGAKDVGVFGSVARGESTASSDVDFLVEMEPGRSLLDMGGHLMDLQDLLGCGVDVVTVKGLRSRFRQRVLDEAEVL